MQILDTCRAAMAASALVRAVQTVRSARAHRLGGAGLRPLTRTEMAGLQRLGNVGDWPRIRVAKGFNWRRLRGCRLVGDVVLGRCAESSAGGETGLYQSTLVHCVIGDDCLIENVDLLAHCVVGPRVVLSSCGRIGGTGTPTTFGNGIALHLGAGRKVPVFAEMDETMVAAICLSSDPALLDEYAVLLGAYLAEITLPATIIAADATIQHTPVVENVYVGPGAQIIGAHKVAESTLLSSVAQPVSVRAGAIVTQSLLQEGSCVATHAVVDRALLVHHTLVERQAAVTDSILGPHCQVARAEVTASLLGPSCKIRHQALVNAALWPAGKSNVAAAAQVGANHTSRAPDQKGCFGEGLFVGLGVTMVYPVNFLDAPYTVLGCGVTALPQKVTLPFSLIRLPHRRAPDLPTTLNEIVPGWVLTDNLYALVRAQTKYAPNQHRGRFDCAWLPSDLWGLLEEACRRLEGIATPRPVYTDQDIEGLGKNFLREPARQAALATYRALLLYDALLAFKARVEHALDRHTALDALLHERSPNPAEERQRQVLRAHNLTDIAPCLRRLAEMSQDMAAAVEQSKTKDDQRHLLILADKTSLVPARSDPLVQESWAATRRLQKEIELLLQAIEASMPTRISRTTRAAGSGRVARPPCGPTLRPKISSADSPDRVAPR